MVSHFFDIDVLINIDSSIWIISKVLPNKPIVRISKSEFGLIKKGIYRKHNSKLNINGTEYWLPQNLLNNIKIKCKKDNIDITTLSFSLQEFFNSDIIDKIDYEILESTFRHLKNKTDDIYIICSKKSKDSYSNIIKKLENKLYTMGLSVKKYYYISETFYNRNDDDIIYTKTKLLLQHLIGLKTEGDKFTNIEVIKYNTLNFYDDDIKTIKSIIDCNKIFKFIYDNSEDIIKDRIKEIINLRDNLLVINYVTHNKAKKFETKEVILEISYIAKTFESFNKLG